MKRFNLNLDYLFQSQAALPVKQAAAKVVYKGADALLQGHDPIGALITTSLDIRGDGNVN